MINPNRDYKGKCLATVIYVDSLDSYIPYVRVLTDDGRELEGSLVRCCPRPNKIKPGLRVAYRVQWSIVADKPMLSKLIMKRAA